MAFIEENPFLYRYRPGRRLETAPLNQWRDHCSREPLARADTATQKAAPSKPKKDDG
jgi:hypothetical protein